MKPALALEIERMLEQKEINDMMDRRTWVLQGFEIDASEADRILLRLLREVRLLVIQSET